MPFLCTSYVVKRQLNKLLDEKFTLRFENIVLLYSLYFTSTIPKISYEGHL